MAALFDPDRPEVADVGDAARAQRVLDDAQADHAVTQALEHARLVGGRAGLRRLAGYERKIVAVRGLILAEEVQSDGDTRRAESMLDDGQTSKREQRRKANQAKAIEKNNDLASKVADGDLGEEQLDVIADASERTGGQAAVDDELIDRVAAVPPEQGKNIVNDYVAERATADGVQTEHDRQRALRRASKWHHKAKGIDCVSLEGDGVAIKAIWDTIARRSNEIYQRDGGRDLAHNHHPRTAEQRKFDAAYELITGKTTTPTGHTQPYGDADKAAGSKRHTPRAARPQIVIGLTVDKLADKDPATAATQIGLGLIPDTVLADYAQHADILAVLFDRAGQPLWLSRLNRYATPHQMIALILRDRGCVLCGADHGKCQAHHLTPWNAPAKGKTDIDKLALLCGPCHTLLHANNNTLYQDHHRTWRTRPATPNETPPPRPDTTRNTPQRE